MKSLADSYKKGALHHAYAIEGDKKTIISEIYNFLENNMGIQTKANPDFYFNDFENFGIDYGRELQNQASRKAMQGNMRIFVITISSITSEAQNSLLKLFEEPAEGVHFFIIIQSSEIFLPTLRSRFNILVQERSLDKENTLASKFIKAQKGERLKLLQNIIEDKNKEEALYFLNNLESTLYKKKSKGYPWTKESVEIFETILKSRDYIRGRAPSVKMILENVSLSV